MRLSYEAVKALRREQKLEKARKAKQAKAKAAAIEAKKAAKEKARSHRIERLSDKIFERDLVRRDKSKTTKRMVWTRTKTTERDKVKTRRFVAYDFETTRIQAGTPRLKYLTAYNGKPGEDFWFSGEVKSLAQLSEILETKFLTAENKNTRFIAWNGNRFDGTFIAAALMGNPKYYIEPYHTKSKTIRGHLIVNVATGDKWEFLDGIAMLYQMKLSEFLKSFAPDYLKLDAPDWSVEDFNPKNKKHVEYAERDSIGLWHGMEKARAIVLDEFNVDLAPTIGNTAIKIFTHNIPHGVKVREPRKVVTDIIRNVVMRGGYCQTVPKRIGPTWKYDINQAYAAAMRETPLPAGAAIPIKRYSDVPACAIWRITATHATNIIPFYYKCATSQLARFDSREITDTWITSSEYRQLRDEGWRIKVREGYWFDQSFSMAGYVDQLEALRVGAPGGPKSALGIVVKAIGNNSYGKTVTRLSGLKLAAAACRPPGYSDYQDPNDTHQHLYFKQEAPQLRAYHQPHIGAFITAYVRMVVRRAALLDPTAWLYADTDSVWFSREPKGLHVHPTEYGAWKLESDGEDYAIIDKKVYYKLDGSEIKAKGMNIKNLNLEAMQSWYGGEIPVQQQIHQNSFVNVMRGSEMYIMRTRRGTGAVNLRS